MSNKPLNKYRYKGVQLTEWPDNKFSLRKEFKKDGEYVKTETFFREELEELRKLIDQALAVAPTMRAIPLPELLEKDFSEETSLAIDDDDINF